MWCFARLLPLMIGELVPPQDPKWENFILMLTITGYLFAPVTSAEIVPYLKVLIEEHHEAFCVLYSGSSIIPKMHYVIHLPDWLLRYVMLYCCCMCHDAHVESTHKALVLVYMYMTVCLQ